MRKVTAMVLAMLMVLAVCAPMGVLAESVAPISVEMYAAKKVLIPGEITQFTVEVLPEGASSQVTWKSSNKAIAKVDSDGYVTAMKKGKVTITATTPNGKKASKSLSVSMTFPGTKVRFYGIGNEHYLSATQTYGSVRNVERMEKAYKAARYGGKKPTTTIGKNLRGQQMGEMIDSIALNPEIDEDDITIFYYSGHGIEANNIEYRGALCGIDGVFVTVSYIQRALDMVPGNVVIIIDSCFSGQMIEQKGGTPANYAREFNDAWIGAFSNSKASNFAGKAVSDSPYRNKYFVLTASSNTQESVCIQEIRNGKLGNAYGVFTEMFLKVIGNPKKTDKNKDKLLSMKEIHSPTKTLVRDFIKKINKANNRDYWMDVQAWPSTNSPFPIYSKK